MEAKMLPAETLLDEYGPCICPCCFANIVPYTVGRVSWCPVCRYTWNVTVVAMNVTIDEDLRRFHRSVYLWEIRERYIKRLVDLLNAYSVPPD